MQWTSLGRAGGRRDGGSDLFLCLLGQTARKQQRKRLFMEADLSSFPIAPHSPQPNVALQVKIFYFSLTELISEPSRDIVQTEVYIATCRHNASWVISCKINPLDSA